MCHSVIAQISGLAATGPRKWCRFRDEDRPKSRKPMDIALILFHALCFGMFLRPAVSFSPLSRYLLRPRHAME
jgi:hypothetical protein